VSQLLAEVTATYLQFLHQMFDMIALLLNDTLKPATPLTNDVINETLLHFDPLT